MPVTRKLSDLFVKGREVVLDDKQGDPVKVYIRKITPMDAEEAYRAANAAKARSMLAKTDPDDLTFQIIRERCEKATKDEIVEELSTLEVEKKRPVLAAELEAEDRWSKDDYLQGLHDAWESGLKKKHFTDPDEETKKVFDEMKAFEQELERRIEREREAATKDLKSLSLQKLKDRYFDEQFDRQAEIAWITEYRKQELFRAVRDPEDHDQLVFSDPREVDSLSTEVIRLLREAYQDIDVDGQEGKG